MSSKQWLAVFSATIIFIILGIMAFNALVDPFGAFGDPIFNWYSYNATNNPRVAKVAYVGRNHERFDSYVLGASGSSAFSVERLNTYLDARFFNLFYTGADMLHLEQTARYLINNYEVRNLVIGMSITNGINFDREGMDAMRQNLHVNAAGGSRLRFYGQYLWMNPKYSVEKIRAYFNSNSIFPDARNWYDMTTGQFNKRARAATRISCLETYAATYPQFAAFPHQATQMTVIDATINSLAAIREMTDEAGINLIVIFNPHWYRHFAWFNEPDVTEFFTRMAEVTPFWDFAMSSVSFDPRFFYDPTHFREAAGNMILARIFNDENVFVPDDFGVFVTTENVQAHAAGLFNKEAPPADIWEARVPILMYHHIDDNPVNDWVVTPEAFAAQMRALCDNGFTAVSLCQLVDFVDRGIPLPPNPIVITFDDGYLSVYEHAFPVLQRYGMVATVFIIGEAVGTDTYKDTGHPTIPKFSFDQARRMAGVVSVQSHSYDMHQSAALEVGQARENMLRREGEREADFIEVLTADHRRINEIVYAELGEPIFAAAFPHGLYDTLTQAVLQGEGVRVTLSTREGINTVLMGMPQSLLSMYRINITDGVDEARLMELIK
jgi:peptidoglycan/xylan/chitin deacetylase (PgdA/CDA1 family)